MSNFFEVNDNNFDQAVLNAGKPVLLEFGAPWCNPCRRIESELVQLATQELAGKISLAKVNVDESPNLVTRFSVMTVPTLILYVDGKPVQQITGFQQRQKLAEQLELHLSG